MTPGLPELLDQEGTSILLPENVSAPVLRELETSRVLRPRLAALIRRAQVRAIAAASDRLELARANARVQRAHIEGLGEQVASICKKDWDFLCVKYGPNWFRDKATLRDTLNRHPEMRVRSRSKKIQVQIDGFKR
jgi:hypothetical protein